MVLPITYIKDGYEVEIMPYFLYEISICKIYKDRFETLGCKYIKSEKPLEFKHSEYTKYNKNEEFRYAKFIDWLGAPEWYIKENKFKLVENIKKKKHGKSTSSR